MNVVDPTLECEQCPFSVPNRHEPFHAKLVRRHVSVCHLSIPRTRRFPRIHVNPAANRDVINRLERQVVSTCGGGSLCIVSGRCMLLLFTAACCCVVPLVLLIAVDHLAMIAPSSGAHLASTPWLVLAKDSSDED